MEKKKKIVGAFLVLLYGVFAILSPLTSVAASDNISTDIGDEIDNYVAEKMQGEACGAVAVSVFNSDSVIYSKNYGYADIENELLADDDTVYEWGSVTKLLTWISVMQLVESGDIDLNEDIRTYLPEDFFKNLKFDQPITMLNLMNHNAGWQEVLIDLFVENEEYVSDLETMLRQTEPEQIYEPGTVSAYSNWGAALGGYIVERVSGESYTDYVNNHIFSVLGMEHTGISYDLSDNQWVNEQRDKLYCYQVNNIAIGQCKYYLTMPPAGGAVGTIEDMMIFAQALIPEDGKSPLFKNKETLELMYTPSLTIGEENIAVNCHGFWTMQQENQLLWHDGGTVGCTSMFLLDTEEKTGMVIMTNQVDGSAYTLGLPRLFFNDNNSTINSDANMADNIEGYYMTSRTCVKGSCKFYSLLSISYVTQNEDKTLTINGETLKPVDDNLYICNMSGVNVYVYTDTDEEGNTIIRIPAGDMIQLSKASVFGRYGLIILALLALIYSAAILFVPGLCGIIVRKFYSLKNENNILLSRLNFAMCGIIIFIMLDIIVLVLSISSYVSWKQCWWQYGTVAIGNLALLGAGTVMISKMGTEEYSNKERINYIMTLVFSLVVIVMSVFYNFTKFWM